MSFTMLRVAVLSSTQFGEKCIREGIACAPGVQLAGIVTTPRQIRIPRSEKPVEIATHCDFEPLARELGCPVAKLSGPVRSGDYLAALQAMKPDLLLTLGWYYKVPRAVRAAAARGCLGIHASLLPKYRGGAPIAWAIINGETETGVSLFHLEDEIDAGDIVAQQKFSIAHHDTCGLVYAKAERAAAFILRRTLPRIANGEARRTPQEHSLATTYPQRSPEDGLIDWSWEPTRIRNFIRAQTHPHAGAYFYANGKKVTVWDASIIDSVA